MKPKTIGIVGGAGPLAGVCLLERVLRLSRTLYRCCKDSDFPKVLLINFPFSEMLSSEVDAAQIRNELQECLGNLRKNGAAVLAIACNTLHAFLEESPHQSGLVHLPQAVVAELAHGGDPQPLVLCTSTSARLRLHEQFFPCVYPSASSQERVDEVIQGILRGEETTVVVRQLMTIIEVAPAATIVLGCTELSLYADRLASLNKKIIDPLAIVARNVVDLSFRS